LMRSASATNQLKHNHFNNIQMSNKANPAKSNSPILIIAGVLLVVLLGGWWFYTSSSSKPATASSNTASNTNKAKSNAIPSNAPAGAQPPNQAGSPTAAVTVEEFADFQCPQCGNMHPVMNELKSTYGSRIHFIFRNFPLSIPAHDKAYNAAVAAEAAGLQGKFWDMQNLLFTNQKTWTASPTYRDTWKEYASKIGLDVPKWENDMAGIAAKGRVDADLQRGKGVGVSSTPSIYINGMSIPFESFNVQSLRQIIDAELQKATPQNQTAPAATGNANSTK
jgi:protein-disulfide isomerase